MKKQNLRITEIAERITALLLIISLSPLLFLIFVILFFDLKELPLFIQSRGLTLRRSRFRIIKFRTIRSKDLINSDRYPDDDIFFKNYLIPHISGFCSILRLTGLDELPQLWNVINGTMSFVGPRPLMVSDLKIMKRKFPAYYKLRNTLSSKPGITGLWQVAGIRSLGISNLIQLELVYDRYRSFYMDIRIILATFPVFLFAKNSDSILKKNLSYFEKIIKNYSQKSILKGMLSNSNALNYYEISRSVIDNDGNISFTTDYNETKKRLSFPEDN